MAWYLVPSTGAVYELDEPRNPHARETFLARVEAGELVEVDESDVESAQTRHGGTVYRVKAAADEAPAKSRKPKPAADEASPADAPAE